MEGLGLNFSDMFAAQMDAESDGNNEDKNEKEIPLTEAGEIDHPLITKYSEFNYPPDLNVARMHGVYFCSISELLMQGISTIIKRKSKKSKQRN